MIHYTECKCRTQYFKNSYFPRVTKIWKSLDKELKGVLPMYSYCILVVIFNWGSALFDHQFHVKIMNLCDKVIKIKSRTF